VEDELAQEAIPQERMFYVQALIAGAVEASKRAVELSPRNVANWETRGAVYQAIADVVDGADAFAIDAYRMAHELEPASPVHLTNLAKSYHAFARRTAILASSSDEAFAEAVQIQVDENLRQAESALLRAIELKADYAPAHYEISIVYEEQGRLAEALAKMESVKRYNPFDVGVAFQLGVLYLRQGKNDLAQMEFERAVELVPTFVNAHWYLASVYELKGDIEAAAFEVAIVLDLDPDNEAVKAKLARLQDGLSIAEVPEPIENSP
ncbi:MAG: tetratricopeptide repeat protein, partial [Patescibacteria group bacterium]